MNRIMMLSMALVLAAALPAAAAENPYYGEIMLFAGTFVPYGWLPCDGRLVPIVEYQALFALLGTMYGGDGRVNFALPDLRGRTPVMPSPTVAGMNRVGQDGGRSKLTYQAFQPKDVTVCAARDGDTAVLRVALPGDISRTVSNRSPCVAMTYCIATEGLWPQRD